MTRTEVATYNGITIVKHDDDWVAQLERSRIRPYDIGEIINGRNLTPEQVANEVYTHLTINEVKAAYQYYNDHPQEMDNLNALNNAIQTANQYKIYECTCGGKYQGVSEFTNHFDGDSHPNHKIVQQTFEQVTFNCDCSQTLRTLPELVEHLDTHPNHRLETVNNNFKK